MGLSGLEPLTSRLSGGRSNQLSYAPNLLKVEPSKLNINLANVRRLVVPGFVKSLSSASSLAILRRYTISIISSYYSLFLESNRFYFASPQRSRTACTP